WEMTTSIGHRWKGGNVRSRVVLIARRLAPIVRPPGRTEDPFFSEDSAPCTIAFPVSAARPVPLLCHVPHPGRTPFARTFRSDTFLGGHGDGAHPLPFRTGKVSPSAPMVLLHQVGE